MMVAVLNPVPDAELVPIAEGVWAWIQGDGTWWVNNAGFVAGEEGDIIVDTCATYRRTAAFLGEVAAVRQGLNLRFAVNIHLHGDHTYGNSLLPATTTIVGHQAMRAGLAVDPIIEGCPPNWSPVPDWGGVSRRLPTLTFAEGVTLHSGGRRVEVRHPGHAAHTTGDSVVLDPDQGVLFAGDLLFHGLTPLVFMGQVEGALRALDWIYAMNPVVVVPGHGPLIHESSLEAVLGQHERYFRLVLEAGRAGHAAGRTPLEVAQETELGEFAGWADAERLVLNLHRVYADLQHADLDLAAAFQDALAYHGGALPTRV